jgi:hypothetical protein
LLAAKNENKPYIQNLKLTPKAGKPVVWNLRNPTRAVLAATHSVKPYRNISLMIKKPTPSILQ